MGDGRWEMGVRKGLMMTLHCSALYRVYTSLVRSEIGVNPPKSPLTRGTKIRILAPLLRGFGGFRSRNEV
jgi:hypothetical protein